MIDCSSKKVDVLLATFQAGEFLKCQLDSLMNQVGVELRVIVRDDGSNDQTNAILQLYEKKYGSSFLIISDSQGRLGPSQNFSELMSYASAPYIAFCDQDDVWEADKLSRAIDAMIAIEKTHSCEVPILIHSDLCVVDDKLKVISSSFSKFQKINLVKGSKFNRLLMQNVVTGCTVLMNQALLMRCNSIPREAIMHDHWLALYAAAFGVIKVLNGSPGIMYRQHQNNALGALSFSIKSILTDASLWRRAKLISSIQANYRQAIIFYEKYGDRLHPRRKNEIKAFLKLADSNWLRRRWIIFRFGFWKHGFIRNIGLMLRI